jgi:predicted esterase
MSSKNFPIIFFLTIFLTISFLFAQNETIITQGLVLKLPSSRGSLTANDPVEQAIVLGTWTPPKENDQISIGDETAIWEAANADTNGWFVFQGDWSIRGVYLYVVMESEKDDVMLLKGLGNDFVYVNGQLRTGNRYGMTEELSDWGPNFDYSIIPIQLKAGTNHLLFYGTRSPRMKVKLQQLGTPVFFNTKDMTLPDLIVGEKIDTWGSVVVINGSSQPLKDFVIQAQIGTGGTVETVGSIIQPMTIRKVAFRLQGEAPTETGPIDVNLQLLANGKQEASTTIQLRRVEPLTTHKNTFISNIDGSVQYYAINPAQDSDPNIPKALVLSVHGAGVLAINQTYSYYGKTWAHIVAPTNRRPYGFNWEDWGRTDAMEALADVQSKFKIDPSRVYLTGHSMGGHGAWHLGGTFPDRFGAIGPSAGWLSFWSYRVRENAEEQSTIEKMLMRATSPSHTMEIAENYKQLGVYILHGADDDNVQVDQARQMAEHLQKFHKDFVYDEQPGQGHWWDISDEPGSDCVDWAPMFDFFARHARPGKERIRQVEFITGNPGISSQNNWLQIEAQDEQLKLSKVNIRLDPGKRRFVGTTENVVRLSFDLSVLKGDEPINVDIDGQKLDSIPKPENSDRLWLGKTDTLWTVIPRPSPSVKGPHRYGTFKDVFNNLFVFVYGTHGDKEENDWACAKARYDAEHFWYQGNGSIDVIPDTEFDAKSDPDRNVILFGNTQTNSAWKALLGESPVQVSRGKIAIGKKTLKGNDLACLFIRPRPGSDVASVGAVAGTGIIGMRMTDRRPYLSPGYAYPDFTVFTPAMLESVESGVKAAGFFGLDWSLENGEVVWNLAGK